MRTSEEEQKISVSTQADDLYLWVNDMPRFGGNGKLPDFVSKYMLEEHDSYCQLDDLRVPPGNRLEALRGERRGQHAVRINDQWRICFVWRDGTARQVEIVDYH